MNDRRCCAVLISALVVLIYEIFCVNSLYILVLRLYMFVTWNQFHKMYSTSELLCVSLRLNTVVCMVENVASHCIGGKTC